MRAEIQVGIFWQRSGDVLHEATERYVFLCRRKLLLFVLSDDKICATLDRADFDKLHSLLQEGPPAPNTASVTSQCPQQTKQFILTIYMWDWDIAREDQGCSVFAG